MVVISINRIADKLAEQRVFTCLVKTYEVMELVNFFDSPEHPDRTEYVAYTFTLIKTSPESGRHGLAAICDLANATPRSLSSPITSPVERISGLSIIGAPGKRLNGNTDHTMIGNSFYHPVLCVCFLCFGDCEVRFVKSKI